MYDLISRPLQFFYELWPNYAGAIMLLTLSIMIILLPLTLKGTRSMLAMQKLQPELRKIQTKYKDDRQKLNEEMMAFYRENNINPVSGCMPLLLQMPVFFLLYRELIGLFSRAPYGYDMGAAAARSATGVNGGDGAGIWEKFGFFRPKHLEATSQLFMDLSSTRAARSFGIDLALSASQSLREGLLYALPYIMLVAVVTVTSFIQQRQVSGRNPNAQMNPQQAMLMKIMPLFFAVISFTLYAGIVFYFLVSNVFRVGQQALITRTLYRDQDGALPTTGRVSDKSSTDPDQVAAKPKGFFAQMKEIGLPNPAAAKEGFAEQSDSSSSPGRSTKTSSKASAKTGRGEGDSAGSGARSGSSKAKAGQSSAPSRTAPSAANRSKSKKKRK
jgi:YidC/Oxa1 family membrane protein insertase